MRERTLNLRALRTICQLLVTCLIVRSVTAESGLKDSDLPSQGRALQQAKKPSGGTLPSPPKVVVTENLDKCPRIYLVKKKGKGAEQITDIAKKFGISTAVLTKANTGFISTAQTPLSAGIPIRVPCIVPNKAQDCGNQYIQNWRKSTTLVDVAIEYDIPLSTLLRLNPTISSLRLGDLPKGTKILVPSCGLKAAKAPAEIRAVKIPFKGRACPSTHVVKASETAATIAEAFNVPLTDLVATNAGAIPEATAPLPNGLRVLVPCTTQTGPTAYKKLYQDLQQASQDATFTSLLENSALAKRLAPNAAPPNGTAGRRLLEEAGLVPQQRRQLQGLGSEIAKAVLKQVLKTAAKKLAIFAAKQCAAKCTLAAVKAISFFTKDIILADFGFDVTLMGKEGVIMNNPSKLCLTQRTDGRITMETCQFVASQLWTFAFLPDADAEKVSGAPMLIQSSRDKLCLYSGNTGGANPDLLRMGPCVTVDSTGKQTAVKDAIWVVPGTALGDLQNFLPSFIERYQQSMALVATRIQVPSYQPVAPASCFLASDLPGYEVLADGSGSADACAIAAVTRGYQFFFVDTSGACHATSSFNTPPASSAQDDSSCAAGTAAFVTVRQLAANIDGSFNVTAVTRCMGVKGQATSEGSPVEFQDCNDAVDTQMWTYQSYTLMEGCLVGSQGRGVGVIPPKCPPGHELQAGLCYPTCPTGFTGIGPVCWKNGCPAGFVDHGATCHAPSTFSADTRCACPWFDLCCCTLASGSGCKTCPAGTSRSCCTCNRIAQTIGKETRGRGAGFVPNTCDPKSTNTELQAGLCYRKCPAVTPVGVGPVCYQNSAPAAFPDRCSDVMRGKSGLCGQATASATIIATSFVLQIVACLLIPFPANLAVCDLPFSPGDFAASVTINAFFARFPPICPSATTDPF